MLRISIGHKVLVIGHPNQRMGLRKIGQNAYYCDQPEKTGGR